MARIPVQPAVQINPLGWDATVNEIPETTPANTPALSRKELFPTITSTPLVSGGMPPRRADINAALKELGAHTHWLQNGGMYYYSEALNYIAGNVVLYSNKLYKCIQANGVDSGLHNPTDTTYWLGLEDAYVPKAGGITSGTITMSKTSGDVFTVIAERADTGNAIRFGVGTGGQNRGINDKASEWWMLHKNEKGEVVLTAKKLKADENSSSLALAPNGRLIFNADPNTVSPKIVLADLDSELMLGEPGNSGYIGVSGKNRTDNQGNIYMRAEAGSQWTAMQLKPDNRVIFKNSGTDATRIECNKGLIIRPENNAGYFLIRETGNWALQSGTHQLHATADTGALTWDNKAVEIMNEFSASTEDTVIRYNSGLQILMGHTAEAGAVTTFSRPFLQAPMVLISNDTNTGTPYITASEITATTFIARDASESSDTKIYLAIGNWK